MPVFLTVLWVDQGRDRTSATRLGAAAGSAALLAGAASNAAGGWLSDRWGRSRTIVIFLSAAVCSAVMGWLQPFGLSVVLAIALLYGLTTAESSTLSTAVAEAAWPGALGTTMAVQSSIGLVATILSPVLFGMLLDRVGWGWAFLSLGLTAQVGVALVPPPRCGGTPSTAARKICAVGRPRRIAMAVHDYHFINYWRVEGTVEEVADIIAEPLEMPRWWPAWCLNSAQVEKGDESGVGRVVNIHAKGWMPYAIRWQLRVGESDRPRRYVVYVTGDLEGRGIWTFDQDGPFVNATLDWKVRANFPFIRYLSFLLKPLFRNNHFWAMDRGEESLRLELARRHAATAEERARIPAPPPPTWPHRRQWEEKLRAGILDAGRPAEGAQVRDSGGPGRPTREFP